MTDSARVLDAIRRLVQHFRVTDRAAQSGLGIPGAQLFVLTALGAEPGPAPMLFEDDGRPMPRRPRSKKS